MVFFEIFHYASGRNGTERNDNFYFRSFSEFSNLKAWNEAIMVHFNFLNFFAIFLEFSIMRRVRTKRNENFYFLCFSSFSNLLWLEMKPQWYFLIFLYFFAPFFKFSITHRVGTERNGTIIFISLFLILFQPSLAWNELIMVFFNFFNFFVIFLEFSITHRVGTKQNDNFYFSLSNPFPT